MKKSLIVFLIGISASQFSCKQAGDAVVEKLLASQVTELNKSGGQMIDGDTRLDSASVEPGRNLIYHYTLVNYTRDVVDTNVIKQNMLPVMRNLIMTNEALKPLRDNDVNFTYRIRDNQGKNIVAVSVMAAEYKAASK